MIMIQVAGRSGRGRRTGRAARPPGTPAGARPRQRRGRRARAGGSRRPCRRSGRAAPRRRPGRASAAARRGRARVAGRRHGGRQLGRQGRVAIVGGTRHRVGLDACERARASIATGDEGGLGWMCVNVFRRSSMRRLPAVLVVAALPLAAPAQRGPAPPRVGRPDNARLDRGTTKGSRRRRQGRRSDRDVGASGLTSRHRQRRRPAHARRRRRHAAAPLRAGGRSLCSRADLPDERRSSLSSSGGDRRAARP